MGQDAPSSGPGQSVAKFFRVGFVLVIEVQMNCRQPIRHSRGRELCPGHGEEHRAAIISAVLRRRRRGSGDAGPSKAAVSDGHGAGNVTASLSLSLSLSSSGGRTHNLVLRNYDLSGAAHENPSPSPSLTNSKRTREASAQAASVSV